jgi:anti-anti-sigma factor
MKLVDWAARWNPVLDDRPCRVWLPAQHAPAHAPAAAVRGGPRSITISLRPQQADDLPIWLPRLLAQQDVRPGDRVTVDLTGLQSVHLTGLELLMIVLWRRVGTQGEVLLTGGSAGLRAQLDSLHLTPAACRAALYGPPPALRSAPGPVPAVPAEAAGSPPPVPLVPRQRRPQGPLDESHGGWDARLALSGDVNLTVDRRLQARLNELLEQGGMRTLAVDLSDVTFLSLSTLRLLLAADRRLRARGGRLCLLRPNPRVQRLLAITRTTYLTDDQREAPETTPLAAPPPVAVPLAA